MGVESEEKPSTVENNRIIAAMLAFICAPHEQLRPTPVQQIVKPIGAG
jgi:hypothetical protein